MNDFVAVQTPADAEFVFLSRTKQGKLFRKQILPMNADFVHPGAPGKKIHVTPQFAADLVRNFKSGKDIVQVPIVNDANQHVEDPLRNAGEVVDLTYDDKGVYATIDARKHSDDFGKTILGASALMHLNYPDTKDGTLRGPTLLHVAATNRPYLSDLSEFEELAVGLSADTSGEAPITMIPANDTEDEPMNLAEIKAALKNDHGIDLDALAAQAEANTGELVAAMSNVLGSTTGTPVGLGVKDVADAVIEVAENNVALSAQVETLVAINDKHEQAAAEQEVDRLVREGRVLPTQRDTMVTLSRKDRETFDALVPSTSIVALSAEGVDTFDAPQAEKFKSDIERLATLANGK